MMPDIDGLTLAQWINAAPSLREARLVMLSSVGRHTLADRQCALRVVAYLEKPVSQADLLRVLGGALGYGPAAAGLADVPQPSFDAAQDRVPCDVLLAEDTPANQKLVVELLEKRGHQVEVARNGQEAVDLGAAAIVSTSC